MKDLKSAILMVVACTVICGGIYPAVVTGIAQAVFPWQAQGSIINDPSGSTVGSRLIGQPFSAAKYFWPRPSATAEFGYNPLASGGSNFGPTHPEYLKTVAGRVRALRASGLTGPIPAELVQSSASGLDPHITPMAARAQISRVAQARGLPAKDLEALVESQIEDRGLGIFGEPLVNVLMLNLTLDKLTP